MEDHEIINLYYDRAQQAITETSGKYNAYCMYIARAILGDEEDAKECVNDTWLKAWNTIPPQKPEHLAAYLGRLTRNIAKAAHASESRIKSILFRLRKKLRVYLEEEGLL